MENPLQEEQAEQPSSAETSPEPEKREKRRHKRRRKRSYRGYGYRQSKKITSFFTERTRRARRRRQLVVTAILVPLTLIAAAALIYPTAVADVENSLQNGQWQLTQALSILEKPFDQLTVDDFRQADWRLQQAGLSFRRAENVILPYRAFLNLRGGDASALPHIISLSFSTSLAIQELLSGLEPLLLPEAGRGLPPTPLTYILPENTPAPGASPTPIPTNTADTIDPGQWVELNIITPLLAGRPRFLDAQQHIQQALTTGEQIDRETLSDTMAVVMETIDNEIPRLDRLIQTLIDMPDLLDNIMGLRGAKIYLILSQNNDELRPTGGFLSSYGVIAVEQGKIIYQEYRPSTDILPPTQECPAEPNPPWWLQLKAPVWRCWDSHWTADFPTLAENAKWFYENGENTFPDVDAVIGIDLIGVEQFLSALGPVEVPGYEVVVTSENVRDTIYFYREENLHKQFVSDLSQAVIARLFENLAPRGNAMMEALRQAIAEKHIMFYFDNPGLAALIRELNGDGAIRPADTDYLFVVDSSLTAKVYGSIQETLSYEVSLHRDGSASSQVMIDWFFPKSMVEIDPAITSVSAPPIFVNFSRVYVPPQSVWAGTTGNENPTVFAQEGEKQMFGNWVVIDPGDNKQIEHSYLIPSVVQHAGDRNIYQLTVQKQPGTRGHLITVRIQLPPGAQLLSTIPEPSSVYALEPQVIEFRTRLETDLTIEVIYR